MGNYQKAEKILPTDRLLAATVLRLFPRSVTPNHLTQVRFVLTPLVALVLAFGYLKIGLVFFILVAFTDALDGAMARTRDQVTDWGKLFDPLADKLLIGSVVIVIVMQHLDFWLGITILVIEIATIMLAAWKRYTGVVLQANKWGKTKMILEVIGVSILIVGLFTGWPHLLPVSITVFYLAIVFALISLGSYGI